VRRVVWSRHALNDFRGVIGYIAADNPAAAERVAERIDRTIQALAATPIGRKGRVSGTYEKVVRGLPYIVAYALGDEPKGHETITVLRVIHGARDWREESWPEE
jgi:toxin ParE1/3/4